MVDPASVVVRETDVAILGMAGRFPRSPDLDAFWRNLRDGVECITRLSDEQLRAAGIPEELLRDPSYVRASSMLEGADLFDAELFGFSPMEATITDPQLRLFLECAWEALENAGYAPGGVEAVVGLYAGMRMSGYLLRLIADPRLASAVGEARIVHANDKDYLATRSAYKLDLRGPCVTVQTACSTSLVAVHMACQALINGECDLALAGGAAISVRQGSGYLHREGDILSPDGHNRAFDARAGGTVGGNGVGIVVLKRLGDALDDRDPVRAVIRGSAVNNDGSRKVGFTAPSEDGQARVISEALGVAGVDPASIDLIEAHGTATALGDTVEVAALNRVFAGHGGRRALATVKSNIGHLEAAAGIAGLIKTVLALEQGVIPPSLHFEHPNPQLDLAAGSFYVPTRPTPWQPVGRPRRAGVSSFGIGGTNAHVVLEAAPPSPPTAPSRPWQVLTLSARGESALAAAAERLARHLAEHPELSLADAAYTLQVGRRHLEHRQAVICRSRDEAAEILAVDERGGSILGRASGISRPVAFLFPGQGAQRPGMARHLYQDEPLFRETVDRCAAFLEPRLGLDLRRVLFPREGEEEQARQALDRTALTQPALFVVEYALAELWRRWGIVPQAMIGHSIGEYVAACVAGTFDLEVALALVAARGRILQELPTGAMTSVPLAEEEVLPMLGDDLALAAVNAPALCTVAGKVEAVETFERRLAGRGVECRRLRTSHAFHSPMMESALDRFGEELARVRFAAPRLPWISNLTGTWARAEDVVHPSYWLRHLRGTVRFAEGLAQILADADRFLVEVGPGRALSALARRQGLADIEVLSSLPEDGSSATAFLLRSLGRLWTEGVEVGWQGLHAGEERRRVALPTYPFERRRYWLEAGSAAGLAGLPARSSRPEDWLYAQVWKQSPAPARDTRVKPSRWLVFDDGSEISGELVRRLGQRGGTAIVVRQGERLERLSEDSYRLDPCQSGDHRALFADLAARGEAVDKLLFLATADAPRRDEAGASSAFLALLFAIQAFTERRGGAALDIEILTAGLHDVTGEEALRPARATLLGFCRTASQEYPAVRVRCVDVEERAAGDLDRGNLLERLLDELESPAGEEVVAYRGRHRWVPAFERLGMAAGGSTGDRLRHQGVYLITGGLGGIGLALARCLARDLQARLVLVGRTPLPPRDQWEELLGVRADEPVGQRIRALQELEGLGGEVLVAAADVADAGAMAQVVKAARQRFGAIHGVVHAAGLPPAGVIALKDAEAVDRVWRPKVEGTAVLHDVLADEDLDFIVLCSSLTSVLGGAGQSDYCAANAFLDAFAQAEALRARGSRTLAIGWCTWREAGMAAAARFQHEGEHERQARLAAGLSNEEGMEVLRRALAAGRPHLLVSTLDLATLRQRAASSRQGQAAPLPAQPRPRIGKEYVAPRNQVERTIAEVWGELLGIQGVGLYDDFIELGGDSLLGVRVISRLRDRLAADLSLRDLYEHSTVERLAATIVAREAVEIGEDELEALVAEIRGHTGEDLRAVAGGAEGVSEEVPR